MKKDTLTYLGRKYEYQVSSVYEKCNYCPIYFFCPQQKQKCLHIEVFEKRSLIKCYRYPLVFKKFLNYFTWNVNKVSPVIPKLVGKYIENLQPNSIHFIVY